MICAIEPPIGLTDPSLWDRREPGQYCAAGNVMSGCRPLGIQDESAASNLWAVPTDSSIGPAVVSTWAWGQSAKLRRIRRPTSGSASDASPTRARRRVSATAGSTLAAQLQHVGHGLPAQLQRLPPPSRIVPGGV